jgi:glycosyltransferase involved in cell wall biosynthesis
MKLLFVINAPIIGGAERHTMDLVAKLASKGFDSTVFALNPGPLLAPEVAVLDKPEHRGSRVARVVDLTARISRHRPDLIVTVNERPTVVATIALGFVRAPKPPIVMIWHSTVFRDRKEVLLSLIHTPIFNRLEALTFISENQRVYWRERGIFPKRDTIILNGVDVVHYSPAARERWRAETRNRFGIENDTVVIGVSAVMRPEKNHLQLLDVIAGLRGQGPKVQALLVGDGPMSTAIRSRARTLGIEDRVLMTGFQSDVRPFVAAFDIGTICSTAIETMSLSALETMAMGIPVVMSDLGGATEIIDGENGRVFPVGELHGLRAALESFFDPAVRAVAGARARETVQGRFNQELMVAKYVAWFKKIKQIH